MAVAFSNHINFYPIRKIASSISHNYRLRQMEHVDNKASGNNISSMGTNYNNSTSYILQYWSAIELIYLQDNKRAMSKMAKPIHEHVLAVNEHTTKEDIVKYCDYLEQKGWKVFNFVFHKDEGSDVENGEINYHVHILTCGFKIDENDQVKNIRKKLSKPVLRELQTKGAELFKMNRGIDAKITGHKHIPSNLYRRFKKCELKELENALKELKFTEIKKNILKIYREQKDNQRTSFMELGADKSWHDKRNTLNKNFEKSLDNMLTGLKQAIKTKDFTNTAGCVGRILDCIEQQINLFNKLADELSAQKEINTSLNEQNAKIKAENENLKVLYTKMEKELKSANKTINELNYNIEQMNKQFNHQKINNSGLRLS